MNPPEPRLDSLLRELEQLRAAHAQLLQQVQQLTLENQQLRQHLQDAHQATARSAAPFRRREPRKVPPDQKKSPGRKPGHPGAHRVVPEHIDRTVHQPLHDCPHCGRAITDRQPQVQFLEELPPVRPTVIQLITERGRCPHCGPVMSTHPDYQAQGHGAAAVQLGPRALAAASALNKEHGLTMRKTCRVLRALTGLRLTPGGLSQALDRVADRLEPAYHQLQEQVRSSPAVYADETSWWVGGPKWWLWVFATPQTTYYRVERSRGSAVVKETLGPDFQGTLVSDCLNSYDGPAYPKHKCIAHHQRAIGEALADPGTQDPSYLEQWRQFFRLVSTIWKCRSKMGVAEWERARTSLRATCDQWLAKAVRQAGDERIQNRLRKQQAHLLGCLEHPAVEPTNNRAERALRPAVIARKLSCGNKTERGRQTFTVLASWAATCGQRGQDFIQFLATQLSPQPAINLSG